MIALQNGDKLPIVAIVQGLLNTRVNHSIEVDGIFGSQTENAVKQFQISTKCSSPTGKVDDLTLNRLKLSLDLSIVDVIDICHPQVLQILELDMIHNKRPMALGCMSNAVNPIINRIIFENKPGSVVLLRFVGHGSQAVQAVGLGRGWQETFGTNKKLKLNADQQEMYKNVFRYSSISGSKGGLRYIKESLTRLVSIFSPYGSIEFRGCNIANGSGGREFIDEVAEITGVPVTAGLGGQSMKKMPRFTGQTYSAFPGRSNLHNWSAKLPAFNMSLP